jgi:hypothetical protein
VRLRCPKYEFPGRHRVEGRLGENRKCDLAASRLPPKPNMTKDSPKTVCCASRARTRSEPYAERRKAHLIRTHPPLGPNA